MNEQFLQQLIDRNIVKHQIESYNRFVDERIQNILNEVGSIEPELPDGEDLVIKIVDVDIKRPKINEADGSVRQITPKEARMRDLTYSSEIKVTMTPIFEGIQQESEEVTIGEIPVMVGSELCWTSEMDDEELREAGEDPKDPGGYFIINGSEKTIISMEEMANNKPIYQEDDGEQTCRINSENEGYVQRHILERDDDIVEISFANVKNTPAIALIRALGYETDKEIVELIGDEYASDIYLNLYEVDASDQAEAFEYIANRAGVTNDVQERVTSILDDYLLPHLGQEEEARDDKAELLANMIRNTIALGKGDIKEDDIDHYANKRLNLAGELLEMQFRSVFLGKWGLVARMKYNFQKSAKRGRLPSLQSTVVADTLSKQIMGAMATGNWVGGRTGVCQSLERNNRIKTLSHLRNIVSPLSSDRQHFEARDLHPTQWGRVCPIKTPEGMNIGLRTHLAMSANVSTGMNDMDKNSLKAKLQETGINVSQ
ncbi:DNA-directed RNA polymerase subunit B'' [Candidatus Nanohalovita haloferacivicina]|uniref:DNA-directed RNA polymerase subunit B'' n=1 Tax=Candidatus Nanohalovita haloferacivicina TaxID=2978046 RepID=UPI00325FD5E9|nr:DNA-directed RNA polymerase subunit B'' [Candidatus Nanohalobia archaeon BNXNv]